MKIYLNLSGRSSDLQISLFKNIQDYLLSNGHEILFDYLSPENFQEFYKPTADHVKHIFNQANALIEKSDVVILETSTPSVTIGYQIFQSLKMEKNIICLYTKGNGQLFIEGIDDEKFQLWEYGADNFKRIIDLALSSVFFEKDVRFNLMLNKKMNEYLNNYSKINKVPKAVYIRKLISDDMENFSD